MKFAPLIGRDVLLGELFGLIGHPLVISVGHLIAVRLVIIWAALRLEEFAT